MRPGWEKGHPPNTTNDIEAGQSNVMLSVGLPAGQEDQDFWKLYHYARLKIEKGDTELELTTTVRDREGNVIVEIKKNAWSLPLPQYVLDKNYTSDGLEVKDRRGHIVLQIRVLPDRIQLQAEWNDEYGRGMRMIQSPYKEKTKEHTGPGILFIQWNDLPGAERQDTDETQIKPWFQYPSKDHWAEWLPPQQAESLPDVKQPKRVMVSNPEGSASVPVAPQKSGQKSRLEVVKVFGVRAQKEDTKHLGFFFNIFYANKGDIQVTAMTHRTIYVPSAASLSAQEASGAG